MKTPLIPVQLGQVVGGLGEEAAGDLFWIEGGLCACACGWGSEGPGEERGGEKERGLAPAVSFAL